MKLHQKIAISVSFFVLSSLTPAFSQNDTDNSEPTDKRVLSAGIGFPSPSQPVQGSIGLGTGLLPEYEGSDNYSVAVLPLIDIRKPGAFFLKGASINTNDGISSAGVTIFHISYFDGTERRMQLVMGPLVRAYRGRDESDNDVLNGLGDIDQSVGIGGFLLLSAGPWLANASVSPQDVGNDKDGLLLTLDVEYHALINSGWKISTGMSTSWADEDYMQGYFGVTDAQADRSRLSRFNSKAGFKDVGLQLKTSYTLSTNWSLKGQLGYWHLLNDAADSPIVKDEGSANQLRGLLGVSYLF